MNAVLVRGLVRRDYLVARSYRTAFAVDALYGALSIALYLFISRTFADGPAADIGAAPSYFAFAAVGMSLGLVVDAAAAGIADRLREEQMTGTLEALLAHPVTPLDLCVGLVGFPFAFALARALGYLAVAAVWMDIDPARASWPGFVLVLLAAGIAFAPLGALAGAVVIVLKRGGTAVSMALFGVLLVSGALFPISALPGWLEVVGRAIPLRFAFEGVRNALFRGDDWQLAVGVLVGFGVVAGAAGVAAFAGAIRLAKARGTLAEY